MQDKTEVAEQISTATPASESRHFTAGRAIPAKWEFLDAAEIGLFKTGPIIVIELKV